MSIPKVRSRAQFQGRAKQSKKNNKQHPVKPKAKQTNNDAPSPTKAPKVYLFSVESDDPICDDDSNLVDENATSFSKKPVLTTDDQKAPLVADNPNAAANDADEHHHESSGACESEHRAEPKDSCVPSVPGVLDTADDIADEDDDPPNSLLALAPLILAPRWEWPEGLYPGDSSPAPQETTADTSHAAESGTANSSSVAADATVHTSQVPEETTVNPSPVVEEPAAASSSVAAEITAVSSSVAARTISDLASVSADTISISSEPADVTAGPSAAVTVTAAGLHPAAAVTTVDTTPLTVSPTVSTTRREPVPTVNTTPVTAAPTADPAPVTATSTTNPAPVVVESTAAPSVGPWHQWVVSLFAGRKSDQTKTDEPSSETTSDPPISIISWTRERSNSGPEIVPPTGPPLELPKALARTQTQPYRMTHYPGLEVDIEPPPYHDYFGKVVMTGEADEATVVQRGFTVANNPHLAPLAQRRNDSTSSLLDRKRDTWAQWNKLNITADSMPFKKSQSDTSLLHPQSGARVARNTSMYGADQTKGQTGHCFLEDAGHRYPFNEGLGW